MFLLRSGWKQRNTTPSLSEVHASVEVPQGVGFWKKFGSFVGPGLMVAVGYMDPGNWATDIAGGSQFGYKLLSVVLLSSLFAMLLQYLALKLGIVTGRDLAQACRDAYPRPVAFCLWILSEIAIAATDLAEVIGSALALNLLFGLPLSVGVVITAADVLVVLLLQNRGFRLLESIIGGLIAVIFLCFGYELLVSQPNLPELLAGFIPRKEIIANPKMLYIAIGILGATVMPHNLYLHSSIIQTRNFEQNYEGKKQAIRLGTLDSTLSLVLAFAVNAAILIVAAAAFHTSGNRQVTDIAQAYHLLDPLLGVKVAGIVFGVALLAAGQNATLTGTIAGQIVMEGFMNIRLKPWLRRLITRLVAIIPALIVALLYGEKGTTELLVLSQVVLSLQLSFAVIPLILFTGNKRKMGYFTNPVWLQILVWAVGILIAGLNLYLLYTTLFPVR
jgi:manganese transport protein